jgi:hypothetical protein
MSKRREPIFLETYYFQFILNVFQNQVLVSDVLKNMQNFLWDRARGEAKGANSKQEQPEDPNVVRNFGQKYITPNQPIVIDDDIEIDLDEPILIFNLLSL